MYSNGNSFGNSSGDSLGADACSSWGGASPRTQPGIEHYLLGAGPEWAMRGIGNG